MRISTRICRCFGSLCTLAFLDGSHSALGSPFVYEARDAILGIRKSGASSEFEANLGSLSQFTQLKAGTSITLSRYTTNQLDAALGGLDGATWSISSAVVSSDGGDLDTPVATLWVTRAPTELGVPSSPPLRKSSFSQAGTAQRVVGIGRNAATYSASQPADPIANSTTAVAVAAGDRFAYSSFMGDLGNFLNTFQSSVEVGIPENFSSNGSGSRADFYELRPGAGAEANLSGKYLGYFELSPEGVLKFTAAGGITPPDPLPAPPVVALSRTGESMEISFPTKNDATVIYSVRSTNSMGLGTAFSLWPVLSTLPGDGTTKSVTDTIVSTSKFYGVTVGR